MLIPRITSSIVTFPLYTMRFSNVLPMKLQVQNCYKINNETALTIKTPSQKQKDNRPRQAHSSALSSGETLGEAAKAAAYMIADAENRSFVAAEAMKEAERISKMAEETDSMLLLVKEIYEHCKTKANWQLSPI